MNTGKLVKKNPKCIFFLQNVILNNAIRSISYDNRQISLFFKNFVVSGLIFTNLKCVIISFSKKEEFTASIKKLRDDPEIPEKFFFFFFYFWVVRKLRSSSWSGVKGEIALFRQGPE